MKLMQTAIIAGLSFFLSTGISFAADLDDIDITIRVVETDDIEEMHNELSLPDIASDTAREHAEDHEERKDGERNDGEHEDEAEHEMRDEEHEEHEDEGDERDEDDGDREDEDRDAHEEEEHEDEHERETPENPESP